MFSNPLPVKTLKDGRSLPALGLGTWLMGGDRIRQTTPQIDEDRKAIIYAIEQGITHIDTAELYGQGLSEEIVAEAISSFPREQLFIATKATAGHHDTQTLPQALDGSLKRLRSDYVDLYYLHARTLDTPFEETAKALNAAYKAGKIRNIGVSNYKKESVDALQAFLDAPILANQVHYNLAYREPEVTGLLEHAREKDYFIVAWRPLRLVKRKGETMCNHNIWEKGAFPLIDEMAAKYGRTNVQTALQWLIGQDHVCVLSKSSSPDHIDEMLGCFFEMDEADRARLAKEFEPQSPCSDTVPLR